MQISIRYFTILREISGKKEETLAFPENQKITIAETLKTLSDKYGKPFTDYLFDTKGQVKNFLQLLINGNSITTADKLAATLQNGDTLIILPPVGGG
ncbi:MAG: MoaD family protein [Candidatus Bathyarchaeota archaeon]|nr:MoaD family protein [Candidatus Termiticorpusculum sp.]MCL1970710.1 MoaD family protein [Candidatus Termiticorpusculum sp.]